MFKTISYKGYFPNVKVRCRRCGALITLPDSSYCPICGEIAV